MTAEANIPLGWQGTVQKMIDEAIAQFARSGFLRNARITGEGNGLTVSDGARFRVQYPQDDGGRDAFYVGDIYDADTGAYLGTGALYEQPDGTDIAQFRTDAATGKIRAYINDSSGAAVVSSDGPGGRGLGRPWMAHPFHRVRWADMSVAATTDTFETLWMALFYKQHAKLAVGVRSGMDASGTAGEVRVLVNGAPLGSPVARGFSVAVNRIIGDVAGEQGDWLVVEIQAKRTTATGAIRVEPAYCLGVPSDAT